MPISRRFVPPASLSALLSSLPASSVLPRSLKAFLVLPLPSLPPLSVLAFLVLLVLPALPASSAPLSAASSARAEALEVVDDTGQKVRLASPPARIVSLSPGATEMLFAAGAGDHIVATVQYADVPEVAKRIERIGDSAAVDLERLLALRPDVVVVWPGGNSAAQIDRIARLGLPVYRQVTARLDDLAPSLRRLGRLAGTQVVADGAADAVQRRLEGLRRDYGGRVPVRVLLEVWNQPLYTVGGPQMMSDALAACGAVNVFGDLAELSPVVQVEAVVARNPDAIVAVASARAGAEWLKVWRAFPALKAARRGNLLTFSDPALSRLGPGAVAATAGLCEVIDGARRRMR